MRPNTEADVLAKIIIVDANACGTWTGAHDPDGYPLIKWRGKTARVTRLIWTIKRGPIPDGLQVLHSCDHPGCVNDAHFFLGTAIDNRADCVAKGRQAKGERNGRYTHPERTARGERHSSRTHPERVPRGPAHYLFGKRALAPRDPHTGRFVSNS